MSKKNGKKKKTYRNKWVSQAMIDFIIGFALILIEKVIDKIF